MAGSAGWRYQPIISAIDELGLRSRVSLLGKIELGVLKWLYQHAQALLFPSLYEGFGLPVLEAFCLMCPVIASAIPSVVEVTGDKAAILLGPTDVNAWAAAIDSVEARDLPATMVAAGEERASLFTWPNCGESVRALLAAALEVNA
jgi:glycosyltransferase involved in cell wall biosynthesis